MNRKAQEEFDREMGRRAMMFPALYALAQRVARLNPDAGEIGPGMLAQMVAEARRIVGEA